MNNNHDILGICWREIDGVRTYRCRGLGPKYEYFYSTWVPKSSYKCISVDWPWDTFILTDPNDHEKLIELFPNDVEEDTDIDDDE